MIDILDLCSSQIRRVGRRATGVWGKLCLTPSSATISALPNILISHATNSYTLFSCSRRHRGGHYQRNAVAMLLWANSPRKSDYVNWSDSVAIAVAVAIAIPPAYSDSLHQLAFFTPCARENTLIFLFIRQAAGSRSWLWPHGR